jgi:hypothetical protein
MRLLVVGPILAAFVAGCYHATPPKVAAAPAANERYCWWTAFRTAVPVDTVAARYRQAYSSLGLTISGAARLGDTAWVNASSGTADPRHEPAGARMVAYRVADSTHFRTYVVVFDSSLSTIVPSCQQISQKAAVSAIAPRELDGEEKLAVWRRRP